jgi:hypothetical protein
MASFLEGPDVISAAGIGSRKLLKTIGTMVGGLLVVAALVVAYRDVAQSLTRSLSPYRRKEVGLWLRETQPGPFSLMSTGTTVAYYSDARWMPMPYASPATMIRYLLKNNPDFVVLGKNDVQSIPFAAEWLDHGIPDPRARLIYAVTSKGTREIAVFRWRQ